MTTQHEPHEGDDYVVFDPATVCQGEQFDGRLCVNAHDVVIDGRRLCVTHAGA